MAKTVVALYDDATSAHQAVNELVNNGFLREDISLMTPDAKGEYARSLQNADTSATAQGAGIGAGLGAALGGFGGLLVGLGALTIPGIGPVLAAGPLAAAVSGLAGAGVGAVAGGVTGGVLGALVDMGIPEERANYYAEGVRRGGTLLVLRTDDERTRDAVDIVNRHHPIDLNERAGQWRESGWSRFDPSASAYSSGAFDNVTGQGRDRDYGSSSTSGYSSQTTGSDYTRSGQSNQDLSRGGSPMNSGDFDRNSNQVNRDYNAGDRGFGTGRDVDYTGMSNATDYNTFDRYDANFRSYFASTPYAATYSYEEFQPAYRYGYDMSRQDRYRSQNWSDIEMDARREWEQQHPGTWERFKDSIRHSWEEFKDAVS